MNQDVSELCSITVDLTQISARAFTAKQGKVGTLREVKLNLTLIFSSEMLIQLSSEDGVIGTAVVNYAD